MTLQRHFSFLFPEKMDGLNDFIFVRSLFLGILLQKIMGDNFHKVQ